MPHRFKVGDKVRIVRPPVVRHTWGGAAYEATISVPHNYTIIELIECYPPQYHVSGIEPVTGQRTERMRVFEHMFDPDWPQVKGGERWRVQIGGSSYIRTFERGLSPPALASAALDMAQDKFEFKSKNPSMLTGKLPNGDLFTLMRME